MEEGLVVTRATSALDHHHAMRSPQVVAQRGGTVQRVLLVGRGEQLLDQVTAQP
jgi:hypothetical protein